ncbi:hypothetical protein RR48_07959 [Papilio machaon]|uniref:Uncharacterized protein n=1 Tax=Papilio machaon TaxID=76193 RepID=A0A194QNM0_PAPMA|nr:hypothetical protein RR48_07959 [Papilio machaon]
MQFLSITPPTYNGGVNWAFHSSTFSNLNSMAGGGMGQMGGYYGAAYGPLGASMAAAAAAAQQSAISAALTPNAQMGSTMDMSKYSIEDKYRYGMYTDPSRSYLDSAALSKAYMYMDQQQQRSYPMDISKMYSEASAAAMAGLSSAVNSSSSLSPRSPAESPDVTPKTLQERAEGSSSSGSNPSPSLPYYQSSSSLLLPQYPGQYAQTTQAGSEFRRPLTVIF